MDPNLLTHTTKEAVLAGHALAMKSGHGQVTPLHVAAALFSVDKSLVKQCFISALGVHSANQAEQAIKKALKRLASVSPPPGRIFPSDSLKYLIKIYGTVTHDHMVLGLLRDSGIETVMANEGGIRLQKVIEELIKLEGLEKKVHTKGKKMKTALNTYGVDLVEKAKASKPDPVFGRDREIKTLVTILSKRTKSNPILIGEPGVGKTAVVEGLADKVVRGDVPSSLTDVRIVALDMGELIAGATHAGEFEHRLKAILKEVEEADGKVVLFIDEIHLVFGAGGTEGSMDAANLLKPILARGQFRCIGATTLEEYRKHVEKDAAFVRRFHPVWLVEPSVGDTIFILRGLKQTYEGHHGVKILDGALEASAQLSSRYITGRFLPDKAIDLLDFACASVRAQLDSPPEEIDNLNTRIIHLEVELHAKEKEINKKSKARVVEVTQELDDLKKKLQLLTMKYTKLKHTTNELRKLKLIREYVIGSQLAAEKRKDIKTLVHYRQIVIPTLELTIQHLESKIDKEFSLTEEVGPDQIAEVVSLWTGIPVTKLGANQKDRLLGLSERLHQRVIGQNQAVKAVAESVLRSRVGVGRAQQPNGSFLFLGPTGCGKTELAKALAEQLFDDDKCMFRIDMSEYMEPHSVARLIGAPPGYAGHESGGQLTEDVRKKPYCVVLFDEVEKAHSSVFNVLLQLLDDGRLTDGQGRTVDFTNSLIIMTSNLGAEYLVGGVSGQTTRADAKEMVLQQVKKHFKPELLNRLDEIVVFNPLSRDQLKEVARIQMKDVAVRFAGLGVVLRTTEGAFNVILNQSLEKSIDSAYGARPIRRWLEREVVTTLAGMLVREEIGENTTVHIDADKEKGELKYVIECNVERRSGSEV